PLGMALGAIAAGNTVIWKPASDTPLSSYLMVERCAGRRGKAVYPMPDEHVTTVYEPLGVVACINPWNFPSAIPLGMALGAIAAGNTVIWKPASDTPLSSYLMVE
ncbi:hypothetical protein CTI14_58215, partial [Methylobacterium radiotolerans]